MSNDLPAVSGGVASRAYPAWRPLDEIKREIMRRAGHINPFEGIRRDDAETVATALTSLDGDHGAPRSPANGRIPWFDSFVRVRVSFPFAVV